MFNLLITASLGAWDGPPYVFGPGRFLEFTPDDLIARFRPLDAEAVDTLTRLPTLFAYEDPSLASAPARVGWVKAIQEREREVRVTYAIDSTVPPIEPNRLNDLSWDLDIGSGEMTRTHWAVKKADLLQVLNTHALLRGPATRREEACAFSRQTIMKASDFLPSLGHSDLDRFLLELGIAGLRAGRERGSLRDRANAVAEFALGRGGAERSVEGEPLALLLVRKAVELDARVLDGDLYNVDSSARAAFRLALERDGYDTRDGQLVPRDNTSTPPYTLPPARRLPERTGSLVHLFDQPASVTAGAPGPDPTGRAPEVSSDPAATTVLRSPRVFLSHASADRDLAERLVNLLTRALHLRKSDVRCTSVPGCRLPLGADTDETLRSEISTSEVFIGLITNDAVSSSYVLFELGARWGLHGSVLPIIGPGVSFTILPGPLAHANAGQTTERPHMQQLVRTVGAALGATPEPPEVYERELDALVNAR